MTNDKWSNIYFYEFVMPGVSITASGVVNTPPSSPNDSEDLKLEIRKDLERQGYRLGVITDGRITSIQRI